MGAGEQALALIGRESTECSLQLLRLSFQSNPAQLPNEFDDFARCFFLRRLIRKPVCE
jgi:hypothetical protein